MTDPTFEPWPKTPRLNRDMIVTEKIDGTNAAIQVVDITDTYATWHADAISSHGLQVLTPQGATITVEVGGRVYWVAAQSRKRLITPSTDNFGFAGWVGCHAEVIVATLGDGRHFGEWWGHGIQRGYGLLKGQRAFSLFNVSRYENVNRIFDDNTALTTVPVLYTGPFSTPRVDFEVQRLAAEGSSAAPGFDRPEGVIVFHSAANSVFKATVDGDESPKGVQQ